jgi:hypothetical protein
MIYYFYILQNKKDIYQTVWKPEIDEKPSKHLNMSGPVCDWTIVNDVSVDGSTVF